MREIKIIRTDRVTGFEEEIVEVHVNGSTCKIRNGEVLVIQEAVPADVQIFARNRSVWEGSVIVKKNGSATVYAGITQAMVIREGWTDQPADQPAKKQQALSGREARIKEVMDSNAAWVASNKAWAIGFYAVSVLPGTFAAAAMAKDSGGWALIWGVVCLALVLMGLYTGSLTPGRCQKCNAPTLTRTDYKERFLGARSVQRIIRNHVTNQDEQRTITVSDIEVTETWLCVSCDHTSTHKSTYVSE